MSNAIKNIRKKVNIFFRFISKKKILTFLSFVIVATILWFMQIYNQNFETVIKLPIKYEAIPNNIVFLDSLPPTINIRLRDDGFSMFRYFFHRKDTLRLDISSIIKGNSTKVLQGIAFDQYVRNSIFLTSQLISYDPVRISFSYAPLDSKKVPVIFDGSISLSPGYLLSNDIKITPDSVTVYGSNMALNKILYLYTTKDTISSVESNKNLKVKLSGPKNIKIVPNTVDIFVPVEAYVQKNLEIPVECLNLPNNLNVKFFPSKVKLSFFVGVSKSDSVAEKNFSVVVDYEDLKVSSKSSIPVRIAARPEYVGSLSISPSNVEFIFEHRSE